MKSLRSIATFFLYLNSSKGFFPLYSFVQRQARLLIVFTSAGPVFVLNKQGATSDIVRDFLRGSVSSRRYIMDRWLPLWSMLYIFALRQQFQYGKNRAVI